MNVFKCDCGELIDLSNVIFHHPQSNFVYYSGCGKCHRELQLNITSNASKCDSLNLSDMQKMQNLFMEVGQSFMIEKNTSGTYEETIEEDGYIITLNPHYKYDWYHCDFTFDKNGVYKKADYGE